jgi:prephenate dehydrogenase
LSIPDADCRSQLALIFERVAIVGFGLIGASAALAMRARGCARVVVAIDRADVTEAAITLGAADAGDEDLAAARGADLILLAAPVAENIAILDRLPDVVPDRALVTDVGSTKQEIVRAARSLPERLRFVGGHPLSGGTTSGVEAARADLFEGCAWILTPDDSSAEADICTMESVAASIGARPVRMDAREHDRLFAYLSHLPQLAVSALMHVVGERAGAAGLALCGPGLRDTARLASSPPAIWRDILDTNAGPVTAALDELIATLERLKSAATEDPHELDRIFESAGRWKRVLDENGR